MSALALFAFISCDEKNGDSTVDFDTVAEDGFYVAGPATGAENYTAEYMMNAGFNEVTKSPRDGMYEKYIWLEAGKDFELVLTKAQKGTRYSAVLEDFDVSEKDNNPKDAILKRGILQIGEAAPAMQVAETGMYHIILDLNVAEDLPEQMIVLAPAEWGVRGACNSWGYTAGEVKKDGNVVTYTWKDLDFSKGQEFKFSHCNGWKVDLDDLGLVKAETGFGDYGEGLEYTKEGGNITVDTTGLFDVVLRYEMKNGAYNKSFTYTTECTEIIVLDAPEALYMIGDEFGNWTWDDEGVVTMIPVGNNMKGHFWAVRQLTAGKGFKFSPDKGWEGREFGKDFGADNITVETTGLYMIYVNYENKTVTVEPANICGMGDAFGGYTANTYKFTNNADGTASITTTAAGDLRMYAEFTGNLSDWWTREFIIRDGKIEYRGNGGDQEPRVAVTAGQTITLNFNEGTGTIQ